MFIENLYYIGERDYLTFIRTWKVMFNRHKLFKLKDAVGPLLTNSEIQFLGLFIHLLPAVSLSFILYASSIAGAGILYVLTCQVPVVVKPISNKIIDVVRPIKHSLWPLAGFRLFLCYR